MTFAEPSFDGLLMTLNALFNCHLMFVLRFCHVICHVSVTMIRHCCFRKRTPFFVFLCFAFMGIASILQSVSKTVDKSEILH